MQSFSKIIKWCPKQEFIIFWIILIIGFALRVYHVGSLPVSLHVDETSIGFNAYSILTTGADEYGVHLPFFFKAFGEYKSPIQIYSTVPWIYLFGLNEFAVRFTSVLYGILGIVSIYLLTKEMYLHEKEREIIALFSMLFLAISPWHIHFSRIAWEMTPFVFFTTLGLYLFLRAQKSQYLMILSTCCFMLSFYSYFAARIFIPLFVFGLSLFYFRFFLSHKNVTFFCLLIMFVLLMPFITHLNSPELLHRWQDISIFSHPPQNQTVFDHIIVNYFRHFSMGFLFLRGDIGMPGQLATYDSVKGLGELYLYQLPLIFLGIYFSYKKNKKGLLVLLLWLLLYPVGSMFANNPNPLARRSIIGVIPFQILSAIGIVYLLQYVSKMKKITYAVILFSCICITLSFVYYLNLYFNKFPYYSADYYGFQYGSKPIVQYFGAHETEYDELVMSPDIFSPYIYFKFYASQHCQNCRTGLPDRYYNSKKKQLYSLSPQYIVSHTNYIYTQIKNIYYPNGQLAFVLAEIRKK